MTKEQEEVLFSIQDTVKLTKLLPLTLSQETMNNNRAKRMFLYMAEKAAHYWFEELHPERIDVGTGKIQVVANGTFNSKYNMTIPKELEEYEG